jgi:Spy/CpxP family protein refolding chaperone
MLTGILKDASAEGIDSRLNSLIQIKEILTPEQYREFLKRPQQHRTGKSKRRLDEKRYGRRHERRE